MTQLMRAAERRWAIVSGHPSAAPRTRGQVPPVRRVTIAFDARLPNARWGPLFHVFRLERRKVTLDWQPVGFPAPGHSLLDGADVGVFLRPPRERGLCVLTLDTSPMIVVMAAGHRLTACEELCVADILDEPFPGCPHVRPEWSAFWSLDEQRGRPATLTDDDVHDAEEGLQVVAAGRAILTVPEWVADGLAHPGVVALPLENGPPVTTDLVWRSGDDDPDVSALVDLAAAWTRNDRRSGHVD